MKLKFLGTRANTDVKSSLHGRHSSLMVTHSHNKVVIDWGEDWEEESRNLNMDAILLTHAHPDHAWGLRSGASVPVFATEVTWGDLLSFPLEQRSVIHSRQPFEIGSLIFEAFPVDHSTRCPAVGYRITAGANSMFYVPDVVYIPDRTSALNHIRLYVGDGATVKRSMVRKVKGALVGHAPIQAQLTWCRKEQVPLALFTHCGAEIIKGEKKGIAEEIRLMGQNKAVEARIAFDGLEIVLD